MLQPMTTPKNWALRIRIAALIFALIGVIYVMMNLKSGGLAKNSAVGDLLNPPAPERHAKVLINEPAKDH